MSVAYSRANPSLRYQELLTQYRLMHTVGEQHRNIPPEETFAGQSLPRHCLAIKKFIDRFQARSVLDYGAGKGKQYSTVRVKLENGAEFDSIPQFWGVEAVVCYDPGYEPFSKLPTTKCDGVICTDVLEHCPQEDIPWIVEELFSFARSFVYANVACYPAQKRLANGENAHCTIQPGAWWQPQLAAIAARHPDVRYFFTLDHVQNGPGGERKFSTEQISG